MREAYSKQTEGLLKSHLLLVAMAICQGLIEALCPVSTTPQALRCQIASFKGVASLKVTSARSNLLDSKFLPPLANLFLLSRSSRS